MRKMKRIWCGILHHIFAFSTPLLAFCISHHFTSGSAFTWNIKEFYIFFFAALTKHKIQMKYEKCIVAFCFAWYVPWKHSQKNHKCDKSVAGLTEAMLRFVSVFFTYSLITYTQPHSQFTLNFSLSHIFLPGHSVSSFIRPRFYFSFAILTSVPIFNFYLSLFELA